MGVLVGEQRTAWEPWYCERHLWSLEDFLEAVGEREGSTDEGSPQHQVLQRLTDDIAGSYCAVAEDLRSTSSVPDDWFPEYDVDSYDDVGVIYCCIEDHYKKQGWDGVHDEPDSSSDSD